MKIAIDLMGGDLGPSPLIAAIKTFLARHEGVRVVVFGDQEALDLCPSEWERVVTTQVVAMSDGALELLRKKDSSMLKSIEALADGQADAVVSCGSTGALLTAGTIKIKLQDGIDRAGLLTLFPTVDASRRVAILDVGASNDSTADHLVQFARLGREYATLVMGIEAPRVYLLSNGSEEGKGSPVTKEAFKLLRDTPGFQGNLEARDVMMGVADVIVTGGFEGNILLKSAEGVAKVFMLKLKAAFKASLRTRIAWLLVRKSLRRQVASLDYKNVGGALLAGLRAPVIKAHGNSDERGFASALEVALRMVAHGR